MNSDVSRDLAAMWGHPEIDKLFRTGFDPLGPTVRRRLLSSFSSARVEPVVDMRRAPTFENLLDELARLGTVSFTLNPADEIGPCRCELELRGDGPNPRVSGRGETYELAALRCLMEGLQEIERRSRHSSIAVEEFLRDTLGEAS